MTFPQLNLDTFPPAGADEAYRFQWDGSLTGSVHILVARVGDHVSMAWLVRRMDQWEPPEARVMRTMSISLEQLQVVRGLATSACDDDTEDEQGLDGATWSLELFDAGGRKSVARWSPEHGPLFEVGVVLMRAAGVDASFFR